MRLIDHDQIRVRPLAACERLSAGNLERASGVVAPVVGHQYRVRRQPVAVSDGAGLFDQRPPVADKDRPLAFCSASWIARSPRKVFPALSRPSASDIDAISSALA